MADEDEFIRQEPFFQEPQAVPSQRGSEPAPAQGQAEPPAASGQDALLREAELKAKEHHEAFLRARAEMDNIRKRAQIDVANAHKYALEGMAAELLPVKDALEASLSVENATLEAVKSGVELTLKQLGSVFDKSGLKEINPVGEKFDPHRHQAISMLPSDKEPNTVINVLQKGYTLNERVIRPALVTVAKGRDG
jgi:molecular chaperone GrpE